ncbi:MAG: hypothetical protein QXZ13_00415 [Candidatus Diapherotrites archaeon]
MDKKTKELIETGKAKMKARMKIVEDYFKRSLKKTTKKNLIINLY